MNARIKHKNRANLAKRDGETQTRPLSFPFALHTYSHNEKPKLWCFQKKMSWSGELYLAILKSDVPNVCLCV